MKGESSMGRGKVREIAVPEELLREFDRKVTRNFIFIRDRDGSQRVHVPIDMLKGFPDLAEILKGYSRFNLVRGPAGHTRAIWAEVPVEEGGPSTFDKTFSENERRSVPQTLNVPPILKAALGVVGAHVVDAPEARLHQLWIAVKRTAVVHRESSTSWWLYASTQALKDGFEDIAQLLGESDGFFLVQDEHNPICLATVIKAKTRDELLDELPTTEITTETEKETKMPQKKRVKQNPRRYKVNLFKSRCQPDSDLEKTDPFADGEDDIALEVLILDGIEVEESRRFSGEPEGLEESQTFMVGGYKENSRGRYLSTRTHRTLSHEEGYVYLVDVYQVSDHESDLLYEFEADSVTILQEFCKETKALSWEIRGDSFSQGSDYDDSDEDSSDEDVKDAPKPTPPETFPPVDQDDLWPCAPSLPTWPERQTATFYGPQPMDFAPPAAYYGPLPITPIKNPSSKRPGWFGSTIVRTDDKTS